MISRRWLLCSTCWDISFPIQWLQCLQTARNWKSNKKPPLRAQRHHGGTFSCQIAPPMASSDSEVNVEWEKQATSQTTMWKKHRNRDMLISPGGAKWTKKGHIKTCRTLTASLSLHNNQTQKYSTAPRVSIKMESCCVVGAAEVRCRCRCERRERHGRNGGVSRARARCRVL